MQYFMCFLIHYGRHSRAVNTLLLIALQHPEPIHRALKAINGEHFYASSICYLIQLLQRFVLLFSAFFVAVVVSFFFFTHPSTLTIHPRALANIKLIYFCILLCALLKALRGR